MKNSLGYISLAVGIVAICLSVWVYNSVPKIGFVNNNTILTEYGGVKDGETKLNVERELFEANLDTLGNEIDRYLETYHKNLPDLSAQEKLDTEEFIKQKQTNYFEYQEVMTEEFSSKESEMSLGIINQINSFMSEYAEQEGYDLVVGANDDGNVLYGQKQLDVTDEFLQALNKKYKDQ